MRMFCRIFKELENVIDNLDNEKLEIDNSDKSNFKYILKIKENICIIFDGEYPFTQPKLFINDLPYNKFLVTRSSKITSLLIQYKYGCLCCKTIFCNWTVMTSIKNILDEITEYNYIKTCIKYHMLVSEINTRKNIPEFLIIQYLI